MDRPWPDLYRLQDRVLARMRLVEQDFYLTGGTALSRGYCHHRHSEDLDFFVNDSTEFGLWRDRCLAAIDAGSAEEGWRLEIILRDSRFGRAVVHGSAPLRIEFVNDVPFRVGSPVNHPELGRLDTRENILANKVSALIDRQAPKDVADIYWLCVVDGLDLALALEQAAGKAAGIFPPLVARALDEARRLGVPEVFWIHRPNDLDFDTGLARLLVSLMP